MSRFWVQKTTEYGWEVKEERVMNGMVQRYTHQRNMTEIKAKELCKRMEQGVNNNEKS